MKKVVDICETRKRETDWWAGETRKTQELGQIERFRGGSTEGDTEVGIRRERRQGDREEEPEGARQREEKK